MVENSVLSRELSEFVKNVKLVKFTERLLQTTDKRVTPERAPSTMMGYRYSLAEEYFTKNAREELEMLAEKGLMERGFYGRELGCPKCGSINLILRFHCSHCNGLNIVKSTILEHVSCGYVGPEEEFKGGKCLKCGKEVKQIGVDYVKQGMMYRCLECKHIFQTPVEKLYCANDLTSLNKTDAIEVILYSYIITPRLEEEINKALYQRKYIANKLSELGFRAESPALIKGRSGLQQTFYMVASSGAGFVKTSIIIEMLGAEVEVSTNEIFALYARAIDVGAYGIVLAAIPRLSDDAKKAAESYGIDYVESPDLPAAAEKIITKFGELVEAPEERMLQVFGGLRSKRQGGE